jgi:hypothetical protein
MQKGDIPHSTPEQLALERCEIMESVQAIVHYLLQFWVLMASGFFDGGWVLTHYDRTRGELGCFGLGKFRVGENFIWWLRNED